jgi:hypothetical protein
VETTPFLTIDTTTLAVLVAIVIVILVGGLYGWGRWF